jgi:hypothetical protein
MNVAAQVAGGKHRQAAERPAFLKKKQKKNRFLPLVFASPIFSVLPGQLRMNLHSF